MYLTTEEHYTLNVCSRENSEFCFPETKSRERLRAEGKQNPLFLEGADIKCFVISLKGVFEKTYTAKRL